MKFIWVQIFPGKTKLLEDKMKGKNIRIKKFQKNYKIGEQYKKFFKKEIKIS